MAQYEDISIDQGSDVTLKLELTNENGIAKDLTGFTAASKIRRTHSNDSATSFSVMFQAPRTSGIINLTLTNAQTSSFTGKRYVYDVEITNQDSNANNLVERILEGQIIVNPSVTR